MDWKANWLHHLSWWFWPCTKFVEVNIQLVELDSVKIICSVILELRFGRICIGLLLCCVYSLGLLDCYSFSFFFILSSFLLCARVCGVQNFLKRMHCSYMLLLQCKSQCCSKLSKVSWLFRAGFAQFCAGTNLSELSQCL